MSLGWTGLQVLNNDGRHGHIAKEDPWFGGVELTIITTDGATAYVRLNTNQTDSGELGWFWWCKNFTGGACWLPLGDHNASGQPLHFSTEMGLHDYTTPQM